MIARTVQRALVGGPTLRSPEAIFWPVLILLGIAAAIVVGLLVWWRRYRPDGNLALRFQKMLLECQSEASPDGVLIVSSRREWLSFNRRFIEMWQIPAELAQRRATSSRQAVQAMMAQVAEPAQFQAKIDHLYDHPAEPSYDEITLLDGRVFERHSRPVSDEGGAYYGRVWYFRDVTERKRAIEELHRSEGRLKQAQRLARIGIWEWDHASDQTTWSAEMFPMYGISPATFTGKGADYLSFTHPDDRQIQQDNMQAAFAKAIRVHAETGQTSVFEPDPKEFRIIRPDGSICHVRGDAVAIVDAQGRPERMLGILMDITVEKAREAAIRELLMRVTRGREQLQALSRRLLDVQESERRHIARELHDEVGQALTGLNLVLEVGAQLSAEALRARLGEAQSLVNELTARVRQLSLDLRPAMLDDLGLLPTLLWHFRRYTAQTRVEVQLLHTGLSRRFAPSVEITAYRAIQEALTNVARHAGVHDVTVRVWANTEILGMQIEDRGAGFDPAAALAQHNSSGLAGVRERLLLLGGDLRIESAPGAGTSVTAELPLAGPIERRRMHR